MPATWEAQQVGRGVAGSRGRGDTSFNPEEDVRIETRQMTLTLRVPPDTLDRLAVRGGVRRLCFRPLRIRTGCPERRLAMVGLLGYNQSYTNRRERSSSREVPDGTLRVVGQPLDADI